MKPSISAMRAAIGAALSSETSLRGRTPEPRHIYVPPSHIRALRLANDVIIGGRGVGKSFWSAALGDQATRSVIGSAVPALPDIAVHAGYEERPDITSYPDPETFRVCLVAGADAYAIWRAVVDRWLQSVVNQGTAPGTETWVDAVQRVRSEPESFARLLEQADRSFADRQTNGLIIFDAVDLISSEWAVMDGIVRDLLRLVLLLRPYSRLYAKVFLREDQFDGRVIANFPDASKILADKVELTWAPRDLHGLLWQYLINAEGHHGACMRALFQTVAETSPSTASAQDVWQLPDSAKRVGELQKRLFASLAGEYMGRDHRRGYTYTWSIGHLADAKQRTSPRSFLAAIRSAAVDSADRYQDHRYPLHYESIKRGVQAASQIRVDEMAEDYPWVKTVLEHLRGKNVPCSVPEVEESWTEALGLPNRLGGDKLPPEHADEGWPGVRRDLTTLGIFETMKDGRINMPDLYRVGFGLGRRGGVKPIMKGMNS